MAERVVVGFIPLLDCAALVAAAECGFAAAEGLDLRLVRETSWANIRDRLIVGQFDAAHMLAPMVVASSHGAGHLRVPLIAPLALGAGGNAVAVSTELRARLRDAGAPEGLDPRAHGEALRCVVQARRTAGADPLVLAMVYPFSCHNLLLRYWLAASGIDPDQDVRLVVIPPPLLVDALRAGQVDAFCVGEPWSSVAVATGVGAIITTGAAIWRDPGEKVLALRRDQHDQHPQRTAALLRAVVRAANWCGTPDNHAELARLLSGPRYVGVPVSEMLPGLGERLPLLPGGAAVHAPGFFGIAGVEATFPWLSHVDWYLSQMGRWGLVDAARPALEARQCWRPDVYRAALAGTALAMPGADVRVERFFDQDDY